MIEQDPLWCCIAGLNFSQTAVGRERRSASIVCIAVIAVNDTTSTHIVSTRNPNVLASLSCSSRIGADRPASHDQLAGGAQGGDIPVHGSRGDSQGRGKVADGRLGALRAGLGAKPANTGVALGDLAASQARRLILRAFDRPIDIGE